MAASRSISRPSRLRRGGTTSFYQDAFLEAQQVVTTAYTDDTFSYVRVNFDRECASISYGFCSASFTGASVSNTSVYYLYMATAMAPVRKGSSYRAAPLNLS